MGTNGVRVWIERNDGDTLVCWFWFWFWGLGFGFEYIESMHFW
jgi:hypothetical protein